MPKTFFDHLNQVLKVQNKNYWSTLEEPDKKTWNTYMMLRYLSMNPDWIEIISIIQPYCQSLDSEFVYKLLISFIPKGKSFIKYIKKDIKDNDLSKSIKILNSYFKCSSRESIDYINILSEEELNNILNLFDTNISIKKIKTRKKNERIKY